MTRPSRATRFQIENGSTGIIEADALTGTENGHFIQQAIPFVVFDSMFPERWGDVAYAIRLYQTVGRSTSNPKMQPDVLEFIASCYAQGYTSRAISPMLEKQGITYSRDDYKHSRQHLLRVFPFVLTPEQMTMFCNEVDENNGKLGLDDLPEISPKTLTAMSRLSHVPDIITRDPQLARLCCKYPLLQKVLAQLGNGTDLSSFYSEMDIPVSTYTLSNQRNHLVHFLLGSSAKNVISEVFYTVLDNKIRQNKAPGNDVEYNGLGYWYANVCTEVMQNSPTVIAQSVSEKKGDNKIRDRITLLNQLRMFIRMATALSLDPDERYYAQVYGLTIPRILEGQCDNLIPIYLQEEALRTRRFPPGFEVLLFNNNLYTPEVTLPYEKYWRNWSVRFTGKTRQTLADSLSTTGSSIDTVSHVGRSFLRNVALAGPNVFDKHSRPRWDTLFRNPARDVEFFSNVLGQRLSEINSTTIAPKVIQS